MKKRQKLLTDEQWQLVEPLLPKSMRRKDKRGKGTKWMVLVDGPGLPLGVRLESASPAEVTLAEATLAEVGVPRPKGRPRQKPERVIADRGYDSRPAASAVEETRHRADRAVFSEQAIGIKWRTPTKQRKQVVIVCLSQSISE